MNLVESFFQSPQWRLIILALAHSLWIGVAIASVLTLVLRFFPSSRPNFRYGLSLMALLGVIAATALAYSTLERNPGRDVSRQTTVLAQDRLSTAPGEFPVRQGTMERDVAPATSVAESGRWIPWLAAAWALGSLAGLIRLAWQWIELQGERRECRAVTDTSILDFVRLWAERLGIRRTICLLQSDSIRTPAVYGIFLPTLLLPVSCVCGTPVASLQAVLLHELAHIQRHDFLISLLQGLVEAVFFFNPAVWWINHQIRREREACCDQMAVECLGEAGSYARALMEWAERSHPLPLLQAVAGESPGSIVERLKRILFPTSQLRTRLPWRSFVGGVLLCGIILTGICTGTHGVFVVAAEILSPAERVQKIQELSERYSPPRRDYGPEDAITVTGTLRNEDGSPVAAGVQLGAIVTRPSYTGGFDIRVKNGIFSNKVDYGTLYLRCSIDGIPRALAGPFKTVPGGMLTNITLIVSNTGPAGLHVTGVDGTVISGASITGSYAHPADRGISLPLKVNERGEATLSHWLGVPLELHVEAPGFQYEEFANVELSRDNVTTLKLKPSRSFTGRVTAKADGAAVSGAEVRLVATTGKYRYGVMQFDEGKLLTKTDESGRLVLDTLSDSTTSTILIRKKGFSPMIWRDVVPGQKDVIIPLEKQIVVTGTLTGDLSSLQGYPRKPVVSVAVNFKPFTREDNTWSTSRSYPVRIEGGAGRFSVDDLFPGTFTLSAGSTQKDLVVSPQTGPVEIKLQASAPPGEPSLEETREVVLRAGPTKGVAAPIGDLVVTYYRKGASTGGTRTLSSTNGEVRFRAPVPGILSWELPEAGMPGFWTPPAFGRELLPGGGPEIIELPVFQAGAVHGEVRGEQGEAIGGVTVSVIVVERPPVLKASMGYNPSAKNSASSEDAPTHFVARSLVLGGKYVFMAVRNNTYVFSDPIKITAERPIQEVRMQMPKTSAVRILVVDDQNRPLSGFPLRLLLESTWGHGALSQSVGTDGEGFATFAGMNLAAPGTYYAVSDSRKTFMPAKVKLNLRDDRQVFHCKRGIVLHGVVRDSKTGEALAGKQIRAFRENTTSQEIGNFEAEEPTDAEGKFTFSNLTAGTYSFFGPSSSLAPKSVEVKGERSVSFSSEAYGQVVLREGP
jgi:beta-lactamase regulating signal transducer with metallopeptidase domain